MSTENPYRPAAAARYADAERWIGKNQPGNLQIYDVGSAKPLTASRKHKTALAVLHTMRGKSRAEKKEVLEMMGLV